MSLLRQVFGPSKDEIWSQLSREIGAEYKEGGFLEMGKVVMSHRQWEITLDTYSHGGQCGDPGVSCDEKQPKQN